MTAKIPPLPAGLVDPKEDGDRRRWQDQVTTYAAASGLQAMRAARRIDGGQAGAKTYFHISTGSPARPHLYTVLPTQLVFDMGDLQEGDPKSGDWSRCRRESNAIAAACTVLSIPFTMALTGGKGVHLEVWLPPAVDSTSLDARGTCADCYHAEAEHNLVCRFQPDEGLRCRCQDFKRPASKDERGTNLAENEDYRQHIARRIIAEAKRILWPEDGDDRVMGRIYFDPLFISPREGSELLTTYGERKGPMALHRKVLWHEGLGPAPILPEDREDAYALAEGFAKVRGTCRPSSIPVAHDAARFDTRWVRELTGKSCPSGPTCYEPSDYGTCEDCPLWG